MADTHDYATTTVLAKDLNRTCVLVGESGGLSAVYSVHVTRTNRVWIETEHGRLYAEADQPITILDE